MCAEVVANVVVYCPDCRLSLNCPLREAVVEAAKRGRASNPLCPRFSNIEGKAIGHRYEDVAAALLSRVYPSLRFITLDSLVSLRDRVAKCLGLGSDVVLRSLGMGEIRRLVRDGIEDVIMDEEVLVLCHSDGSKEVVKNPWPHMPGKLLNLGLLSGDRVDDKKPYVKYSIKLGGFKMRIVVEVPPLVPKTRAYLRFHTRILTALDLIELGTISPGQLAALISSLLNRKNVVIVGPPSSGKTTLLNVLDSLLPPNLHRVYIDEADETIDCPNIPQTKIKSLGPKLIEVFRAMHRAPDLLVVGELQYRDHFKALAHAVELGVPTLATSHAKDVLGLLERFRKFGVEMRREDLVVVVMRRANGKRFVVEMDRADVDSDVLLRLRGLSTKDLCSSGEVLWGGAST